MMKHLLYVLLIWPNLISCSLYKQGYVRDFSTISSKQASSLIHCGAICKSEQFCLGFSYKEKHCYNRLGLKKGYNKEIHGVNQILHSGLDWHKIKTLGIVLSCVVKVIPLPVFLETMTIQCGIGQLLF